ncbi:MAG: NAD+ synthase [Candidatus Omnitrophica bacterium]|nr:NAD+ synthase [Candidatus Omnitrophota bacterium]
MLRIALAQIDPTVGDLTGNRDKIEKYIAKARARGVALIVFPELALTGYPPEDLLLKGHFIEDNKKALDSIVQRVKGITAVIGFVDGVPGKAIFNAAAVIRDGKTVYVYHKRALPNYSVFDEKRYFTPGAGEKVRILKSGDIPFAVNICEDIWDENGPYKAQARAGAKLILNLSASPFNAGKVGERLKLLRERAVSTGSCIAYVNIVGGQDELVFDGASVILDQRGRILASGKQFEEDLVVHDLDNDPLKRLKRYVPGHKTYSGKEEVYRALILGTRDYVRKNGFKKVVLGLSGGIDSALTAAIAEEALGKENVIGVSMPSGYTSKGTKNDAYELACNLGIKFYEIPIEKLFREYTGMFAKVIGAKRVNIVDQNIQARIRGNILMALSNQYGWLVLTTGNKSEVAVGYCTLYGDMAGGFGIIKDLFKTMVYEVSELVNELAGKDIIPVSIIKRPPTAELKHGQRDTDSLPPYDILDPVLKAYIEDDKSISRIASGKDSRNTARKIINMVDRSEYKRRQGPPGIRITPKAFGKDRRLPITNLYRN